MIFDFDQALTSPGKLLEQAAAQIGWRSADMEDLLESELNTDQLLAYLTAIMSNRMN